MKLSPEARAEADRIISRYPERRAAMLPLLWFMERECGAISTEVEQAVADILEISPQEVHETTTFYTMFRRPEMGRHIIQVCHTLPCALNGSREVVDRLRERLGIEPGQTTPDKKYTLMKVECLASCDTAPCLQVNDKHYHNITAERVDSLLEELERE